MRAATLTLLLVACGGRTQLQGTKVDAGEFDAPASDTVACGDAGSCPASTEYCRIKYDAGALTYACEKFSASCHMCSCLGPTDPNTICTCSGDGDEITISCKPF